MNTEEVLQVVTEGMEYLGAHAIRREVGKSAISAARTRLGADVMHTIARSALIPLATELTTGAFYRGMRLVSLDGSTLEVADGAANRKAFGVPGTQVSNWLSSNCASWACWRTERMPCSGSRPRRWHKRFEVSFGASSRQLISGTGYARHGQIAGLSGYPLW